MEEGTANSYAPLLSPLLPPSGWGWRISGSEFLMLNSPFLPKPSLEKVKRGHFKARSPTPRASPNLGVPPEGRWGGVSEEGAAEKRGRCE